MQYKIKKVRRIEKSAVATSNRLKEDTINMVYRIRDKSLCLEKVLA